MSRTNDLWSKLIIDELVRCGVTRFVIAPGSRSTPLVAAAAHHERAKITVHTDERGAAFYALGCGRATGKPAVVITTSGTALANLLPAVVESSMDNVPLLLLTADRPPELRDCSANQTIQQVGIFSSYPRWSFDLPCPDADIDPAFVLTTVDQACFRAVAAPAGPVHLNCMFREPLTPDGTPVVVDISRWPTLTRWVTTDEPYTHYQHAAPVADRMVVATLAERFSRAKRPLLVVGELRTERERSAVAELAHTLSWPVLADVTSGLRRGTEAIMAGADLLLSDREFRANAAPDCCLQIGGRITSSRITSLLTDTDLVEYALVNSHPRRHDPNHRVTTHIVSGLRSFCGEFATLAGKPPTDWRSHWLLSALRVQKMLDVTLSPDLLTEPGVCRMLSRIIPDNSALFLASSMPIRYMDMYEATDGSAVPVQSNRGASGIDGAIATTVGYATDLGRPATLLIGDQAFLHDLNSLLLLRSSPKPITVVLLNNDGGRIFEHLPIAQQTEMLSTYFVASHGLRFDKVASQFGLPYSSPETLPAFRECYAKAQKSGQSALIELVIDPKASLAAHRQVLQAVTPALQKE